MSEKSRKFQLVTDAKKRMSAIREDLGWQLRNKGITGRIYDKYWDARTVTDNAVKGWNNIDAVSLCDTFPERLADILDVLSQMSYADASESWKDELGNAADTIRAYGFCDEILGDMFLDYGFYVEENGHRQPIEAIEQVRAQLQERFLEQWKWVGDNIFSDKFIMPDALAKTSPLKSEIAKRSSWYVDRPNSNEVLKAKRTRAGLVFQTVFSKFSTAANRLSSPRNIAKEDLANMPYGELVRLSDVLYEMAGRAVGYPYGYASSGNTLYERDEQWGEQQAITAWLMGPGSNLKEMSEPVGEGVSTIKKNKDVDEDYSAWMEDIVYAARVFAKYASWKGRGGFGEMLSCAGVGEAELGELAERIEAEFMNAWMWLGKNIRTMWV